MGSFFYILKFHKSEKHQNQPFITLYMMI